jgi:hypothetical protein
MLAFLTTWVCNPPMYLRDPPPCSVPCRQLLWWGMSTMRYSIDGWCTVPSTLCSVTKLLLVETHQLKCRLQLLLEPCCLLRVLYGNCLGTSSCLGCTCCRGLQVCRTCSPRRSRAPPLVLARSSSIMLLYYCCLLMCHYMLHHLRLFADVSPGL